MNMTPASQRMLLAAASVLFSLLLTVSIVPARGADAGLPALSAGDIQRLGERMYREGLLPSGEPLTAVINDDVTIPGNAFSCESCHMRSGIGSVEGQILSPPTNGLKLYKPYYQYPPVLDIRLNRVRKAMWDVPAVNPIYRPAYTDETLAAALLAGVDPTGRTLNGAMPRYKMDDKDMEILIAYLKTLSAEVSPGVDTGYKYIRFATVIAGDVPEQDSQEMLALLNSLIASHNRQGQIRNRYQKLSETETKPAPFNYPKFTLAVWRLKGPATTWRAQLEEQYRSEPVFALLGGLSAGDWRPMHEFSEQNKIPALLPVTDLPVVSETDWYTLYFSKGVYQEGEASARYLFRTSDPSALSTVLQVVEDSPRARALAAGFNDAWKELASTAAETASLAPGEAVTPAAVNRLIEQKHPSAILLWTSAGTLPVLEGLAADKAARMVFVSSTLLGKTLWNIPEKARAFTWISYPYRLADGADAVFNSNARNWMRKRKVPDSGKRISTRLYSLTNVLLEPFQVVKRDFNPAGLGKGRVIMEEQFEMMMHVRRNYYRDYLFDVIGMFGDRPSLDYERLSFGPGQRYMSKGCYIVQLSAGPKPDLIRKSDWVIH